MSFKSELIAKCSEYVNFTIDENQIQIPYKLGKKNTPTQIEEAITDWMGTKTKTATQIQTWVDNNPSKTGIDCSGLVYYVLNEASDGAVRTYFEDELDISTLTYAYGISANNLTSTAYGTKKTSAKKMTPGCTIRFDDGGHVLVIYSVVKDSDGVVTKIKYTHSNGSKGPHNGYVTIGDENADLDDNSQTWHDSAYTDTKAKSYYNYTIKLSCL